MLASMKAGVLEKYGDSYCTAPMLTLADAIKNGEIQLVVNTPIGKRSAIDDSYIRKAAIKFGVPYITSTAAAIAAARGIAAFREKKSVIRSLQEFHEDIG